MLAVNIAVGRRTVRCGGEPELDEQRPEVAKRLAGILLGEKRNAELSRIEGRKNAGSVVVARRRHQPAVRPAQGCRASPFSGGSWLRVREFSKVLTTLLGTSRRSHSSLRPSNFCQSRRWSSSAPMRRGLAVCAGTIKAAEWHLVRRGEVDGPQPDPQNSRHGRVERDRRRPITASATLLVDPSSNPVNKRCWTIAHPCAPVRPPNDRARCLRRPQSRRRPSTERRGRRSSSVPAAD